MASAPHTAALDLVRMHEPPLILLDLRMRIMDGWSFVQPHRRYGRAGGDRPDERRPDLSNIAAQVGADGQPKKPFDLDAFDTCIATQLHDHSPSREVTIERALTGRHPPR